MKKLISILFAIIILTMSLVACGNMQLVDTVYSYDKAIISMPNGEIVEGKVDSWRDYEDGDQIQVTIAGKTYLVHSSNIVLIVDKEKK